MKLRVCRLFEIIWVLLVGFWSGEVCLYLELFIMKVIWFFVSIGFERRYVRRLVRMRCGRDMCNFLVERFFWIGVVWVVWFSCWCKGWWF